MGGPVARKQVRAGAGGDSVLLAKLSGCRDLLWLRHAGCTATATTYHQEVRRVNRLEFRVALVAVLQTTGATLPHRKET